MDEGNLLHESFCEYGNLGSKQGLLYYCNEQFLKKFIVVIIDFIDGDSEIKIFDELGEALKYYEDSLEIKTDYLEQLQKQRNKLNREISKIKKSFQNKAV